MSEVDATFEELSRSDDGHGRVPSLPAHACTGVRLFSAELFDAA
ncbi:MAG TPA: hypothetical protein VIQ76_13950 [Propionibacteriaceae bacterium]